MKRSFKFYLFCGTLVGVVILALVFLFVVPLREGKSWARSLSPYESTATEEGVSPVQLSVEYLSPICGDGFVAKYEIILSATGGDGQYSFYPYKHFYKVFYEEEFSQLSGKADLYLEVRDSSGGAVAKLFTVHKGVCGQ